jgi:hypothetical protein
MNSKEKSTVLILYNNPHKPQMVKLQNWLIENLPQFNYKLATQFLFAWKLKKLNPVAVITYNKHLYTLKNVIALKSYANNGGNLIALHHNISSMHMRRPEWLDFVKVRIEKGKESKHPWSVIEGSDLYFVNLNPEHPITTNDVNYSNQAPIFEQFEGYNHDTSQDVLTVELNSDQKKLVENGKKQPAILFQKSEYFINHIPIPDPSRELLFGIYFNDPPSKRQFVSANGGWTMVVGKGRLTYLMPGHSPLDYNEEYCTIIRNCILFK